MYSMKETCQKVNMTYETLKFYCNEGLVPNVKRDKNNYRIFDDKNINWLNSLSCLKKCGMSIQDMKTYLSLCLKGQSTIPERKIMLDKLKVDLMNRIVELNESVDFIDNKQQFYDDALRGKIKYNSNLINIED
ncbi:MerR family transcriptional regulator [Desulfosporosinus sp. FKB]|uniref:MerR family transcriptional regulator n=1 Tax=Desulfosporosinus sp. FKB TaxID=1969835 RepID=UPI000B4A1A66|nr:MerR family transcriptional regulator [Desulfosporosinus sp. FKB]